MEALPKDMQLLVLKFVAWSPKAFVAMQLVCKAWRTMVLDATTSFSPNFKSIGGQHLPSITKFSKIETLDVSFPNSSKDLHCLTKFSYLRNLQINWQD
jgi:hypothetical protein